MEVKVVAFDGVAAKQFIGEVAKLRIEVFRAYPYLYDGSVAYEQEYLQTYLDVMDSIVVLAFDGEKVVGASTGIPMKSETENVKGPWEKAGYDVSKIFYFGESVLLPTYRGKGIGVEFFNKREAWAQQIDGIEMTTFCAVVRDENDLRKPEGYISLDAFWQKRGYKKMDKLLCEMSWQEIGEEEESSKKLMFWNKRLEK
ncbi:GNAT family N-acetyltransferase [Limibacter armeniacum]|uniref:GNAT family N-acetyltransferase n=1 Tax=Limibacter armeniacum TaxID=466084 RepID=UPI002FE6A090